METGIKSLESPHKAFYKFQPIVIMASNYHSITKYHRLGVLKLNESDFITALKAKRSDHGVPQTRLALMAGISREHLNRIEAGMT